MEVSVSNEFKSQMNFQTQIASELWLNLEGKSFLLVDKTVRMGRAPDNDIVLSHRSCSRYHALVTIANEQVIFEDLQSRNGIRVRGEQVKRAELQNGDEIQIGDVVGRFTITFKKAPSRSLWIEKIKNAIPPMFIQKRNLFLMGGVLGLILILGLSLRLRNSNTTLSFASETPNLVNVPIDRSAFYECIEFEDLGNYRKARSCFSKLPLTADVYSARQRIEKQQLELAERRYKEGVEAFENYYYDIAILKWQEVLLIADDQLEYFKKAIEGIKEAEKRKQLQ